MDLPESSFLRLDDVLIDRASGLPVVPLVPPDPRYWWLEEPGLGLDPKLRFTSSPPTATAVDPDQPRVALLATYKDHATALRVAEALAQAQGNRDAETVWLTSAGVAEKGHGFDWPGIEAATVPFVQVIDRWLLVGDLAYREEYEEVTERVGEKLAYRSPLVRALLATADSILVEGDRRGEGAVAFEMLGSGDPTRLTPA